MNIFISYSTHDSLEFAERIYKLLNESPNYKVWMDKKGIRPSEHFDSAIEQGLRDAEVVVAILSPSSVRDGGFCRNEISYALAQSKLVIPIKYIDCITPVQIHTIQQIDYCRLGEDALKCLTDSLCTLESKRRHALDFTKDVKRMSKDYTPREHLTSMIGKSLSEEKLSGVLITGLLGTGKSAYLAHLAATSEQVGAVYFCKFDDQRTLDPGNFLKSISSQLSACMPDYDVVLQSILQNNHSQNHSDMLMDLLLEPLQSLETPHSEKWILVDSIDESRLSCKGEKIEGEIIKLIATAANETPEWLKFVVSSRPSAQVQRRLSQFKLISFESMGREVVTDLNRFVLHQAESETIIKRLTEQGISSDHLANILCEHAGGSFLYAKGVLRQFAQGTLTLSNFAEIPQAVEDEYLLTFKWRFHKIEEYHSIVSPVLTIISFSLQPLSPESIARFLDKKSLEIKQVLKRLEGLIFDDGKTVSLGQRALYDWLTTSNLSEDYCLSDVDAQKSLNEVCKRWDIFLKNGETYPLRWGPTHAILAGEFGTFHSFLLNSNYRREFKKNFGEEEWSVYLDQLLEKAGSEALADLLSEIDRNQDATLASDLGLRYYRREKLEEAKDLFNTAIRHAEKQELWDLLAESLARRGWVESSLGQSAASEEWYRKCRDVSTQHNSETGLMTAYQHYARIYFRKEEYDKSRECYQQVISLATSLNRKDRKLSALCGLGELSTHQGLYSEAMTILEEAISLGRETCSRYNIMVANTLWARAALLDPSRSIKDVKPPLEEALRIGEVRRTERGIGEACLTLGEVALREGNTTESIKFLQRATLSLWSSGPRFVKQPLVRLTPLTSEGDLYERAITQVLKCAAGASPPSSEVIAERLGLLHRETSTAVTLIGDWPLVPAEELLDKAKRLATNTRPDIEVEWRLPQFLHFTIMPLKRHNRSFTGCLPPLSLVCKLASMIQGFVLSVVCASVMPSGGIVLILRPEDQSLAMLRLGLRLLIPEVDDSELFYFPHVTLGHISRIGSQEAFHNFREELERDFQNINSRLCFNHITLVNYHRRTLESVRGEFTWPLGVSSGCVPTDQEITEALQLKQKKTTRLLDDA